MTKLVSLLWLAQKSCAETNSNLASIHLPSSNAIIKLSWK